MTALQEHDEALSARTEHADHVRVATGPTPRGVVLICHPCEITLAEIEGFSANEITRMTDRHLDNIGLTVPNIF